MIPNELAKHAFEGTRDEFAKKVQQGDVIVGGRNFGCGSSREHAPLALMGAGVKIVVAQSFARIFFRNSINVGVLPRGLPGCRQDRGRGKDQPEHQRADTLRQTGRNSTSSRCRNSCRASSMPAGSWNMQRS